MSLMDGYLSKKTVDAVREVLESKVRRKQMVERNYEIANRHYSYAVLRKRLDSLLNQIFNDIPEASFPAAKRQALPAIYKESMPLHEERIGVGF